LNKKCPIYQNKKKNFLGRGTAPCPDPSWWEGHPHGTCGASNLVPLALAPPSQNPKNATATDQLFYLNH